MTARLQINDQIFEVPTSSKVYKKFIALCASLQYNLNRPISDKEIDQLQQQLQQKQAKLQTLKKEKEDVYCSFAYQKLKDLSDEQKIVYVNSQIRYDDLYDQCQQLQAEITQISIQIKTKKRHNINNQITLIKTDL